MLGKEHVIRSQLICGQRKSKVAMHTIVFCFNYVRAIKSEACLRHICPVQRVTEYIEQQVQFSTSVSCRYVADSHSSTHPPPPDHRVQTTLLSCLAVTCPWKSVLLLQSFLLTGIGDWFKKCYFIQKDAC